MHSCRQCSASYAPKDWEIASRDFLCLACRRAYMKAYRARRKSDGNPVVSGRAPREYHLAYQEQYKARPDVKERKRVEAVRRRLDPVEKIKNSARRLVRSAIASDRLIRQPCEVCASPKVDAHHDDYAAPLAVRWLCRRHHRELHAAKATGAA